MRIIAGSLKGRQFQSPHGYRTHPMSEKVRGGLFNILGDIEGLSVLDAFAGSGALSFEAISRGAKHATAIDIDKNAHKTAISNVRELGIGDRIKITQANVSGWSDNNPKAKFDLVFVAPPYDDIQPRIVEKLTKHMALKGLFILDWPGKVESPALNGLKIVEQKDYGDAQLVFYRRVS